MTPETTEDVLELLRGYLISASLGAALELGLFWLLDEQPMSAAGAARTLNIPLNRCQHWLQILCGYDLLEESAQGYAPSRIARKAILAVLSQDTWAFQAREERDSSLVVQDLALNLSQPVASWQAECMSPSAKLQHEQHDPAYVERFTRKLYEIHLPLADAVAHMLDLRGISSLLDLGGGSGVVSFALLRQSSDLSAVVVDFEDVCRVGREMACEQGLEERITYVAADILHDALPAGFDMVLLCDVGVHAEVLFGKIYDILNPGGRLVIVDKFAPSRTSPAPSRVPAAFLHALECPSDATDFTTADMVQTRLERAGFRNLSVTPARHTDNLPWNVDWSVIEAAR